MGVLTKKTNHKIDPENVNRMYTHTNNYRSKIVLVDNIPSAEPHLHLLYQLPEGPLLVTIAFRLM